MPGFRRLDLGRNWVGAILLMRATGTAEQQLELAGAWLTFETHRIWRRAGIWRLFRHIKPWQAAT